jgi:Protein of unknown function (DUF4238)
MTSKPKAHHFIPVGHLARFSQTTIHVPPRDRLLHLYDKRSGSFRRATCGKTAVENDLYTFRIPTLAGVPPEPRSFVEAIFDASNKDPEVEIAKAEVETNGVRSVADIASWPTGPRTLTEDDRAPLLAYVGLLLAQHPAMMTARSEAVRRQFWQIAEPVLGRPRLMEAVMAEMCRGLAALAMVGDGFETSLELNYLGWQIIRRTDRPNLILGDVGVAAVYPEDPMGTGDVWTVGARFFVPLSPSVLLVLGDFAPGDCLVAEPPGSDGVMLFDLANTMSWARSRAEIYAGDRQDLDRALALVGPLQARVDHSAQLRVRESVLPRFEARGPRDIKLVPRVDEPDGPATRARFEERFVPHTPVGEVAPGGH